MSYWRMAGMDPYAVCLARHKAGKIMIGHAKSHVIKASRKEKHYSYALKISGTANVIQNSHPKTQNRKQEPIIVKQVTQDSRPLTEHLKPKTRNRKPITVQLKSKIRNPRFRILKAELSNISKFDSRAADQPKPEAGNPKQSKTRPRHFWHSPKKTIEPKPLDPAAKENRPRLHLIVPMRATESNVPQVDITTERALSISKTQNPTTLRGKPITTRHATGPSTDPKSETSHSKQGTKSKTQDLKPDTGNRPLETGNPQPETPVGYIPSTPALKVIYPKVAVGAAALPE